MCQREGCQGNTPRKVVDSLPYHSQTNLTDEEGWKRVPAWCHGHTPRLPTLLSQVPLSNWFGVLEIEGEVSGEVREDLPRRGPRARWSSTHFEINSARKDSRVIVVSDSFLRGTEGPICRLDPSHWEVCSFPGAQVRDTTRKFPKLVRSTDYFPLLRKFRWTVMK